MALYELSKLSFFYPDEPAPALEEISLSIAQGEFVLLCGSSGGGKTTLLRQLKSTLTPHGRSSGALRFQGKPLGAWSMRSQAARIGYLQQSPQPQIVTQTVWQELAFGLENLGYSPRDIRLRVAEMAEFFGMESWFHAETSKLSGGQMQMLNLASILAMEPEVLLLDEPAASLDPISASQLYAMLGRINRELGVTLLISAHRLEEAAADAGRLLLLEKGRLLYDGSLRGAGAALAAQKLWGAMPTPMRVWAQAGSALPCPLTVPEGRAWLSEEAAVRPLRQLPPKQEIDVTALPVAVRLKEVYFRYEKGDPMVLKGVNTAFPKGCITAVLGGNGAGKSSLLSLLSGALKPNAGSIFLDGERALLPQDARALFLRKSLLLDLQEMLLPGEGEERLRDVISLCRLDGLLMRHPFDLSGGERQRAALAKLLLSQAEILLLDEPTRGMDAAFEEEFAAILRALLQRGKTVVMVSHDVEFCARHADLCALLFDGAILAMGTPSQFFTARRVATTAANRMARHLLPAAVTAQDILDALGTDGDSEQAAPAPPLTEPNEGEGAKPAAEKNDAARGPLQEAEAGRGGQMAAAAEKTFLPRRKRPAALIPAGKQIPGRRLLIALCFCSIPLTLFSGLYYLPKNSDYLLGLLLILEVFLLFTLRLEGRRPSARELTLLAVLCAIGVAGRAAFFWLPQCKPVAALVVVTGIALGGEAGFLVGAMTGFLSGFLFGQGPWTPFQMLGFGLIGWLAGLLFHRRGGGMPRRVFLALFGGLAACFLYGVLLDFSTALLIYGHPSLSQVIATCILGFPFNVIHGAATAAFLLLGGPLLCEALERVRKKYGLVYAAEAGNTPAPP